MCVCLHVVCVIVCYGICLVCVGYNNIHTSLQGVSGDDQKRSAELKQSLSKEKRDPQNQLSTGALSQYETTEASLSKKAMSVSAINVQSYQQSSQGSRFNLIRRKKTDSVGAWLNRPRSMVATSDTELDNL